MMEPESLLRQIAVDSATTRTNVEHLSEMLHDLRLEMRSENEAMTIRVDRIDTRLGVVEKEQIGTNAIRRAGKWLLATFVAGAAAFGGWHAAGGKTP